jgi:hypothetical protein
MMKTSIVVIMLCFALLFSSAAVMATSIITNGDFSHPDDLSGFTATGTVVSEPTGNFALLETDGSFLRTLEQTFTVPTLPTFLSFNFAFSTEGTPDKIPQGVFPDSFATSKITTLDGDILDLLVVDVYSVVPDPESIPGATPINVSYDPSVTIDGFDSFAFASGTTFYGRISLWLPDNVLGEEATLYFDLFDELDTFATKAAVDNISAEPIPEPGTVLLLSAGLVSLLGLYGIKTLRNSTRKKSPSH